MATIATIAAALAAMPGAQAATTPTWKVDKVYPAGAGGSGIGSVSAVAASDVWAAGGTCTTLTCTKSSGLVSRWNGRAWLALPAPSAVVDGIAATSASNAWALEVPSTTTSTSRLLAQHWTGRSWSTARVVGTGTGLRLATEVAPSASSVWAFGWDFSLGSGSFVAHYNGTSWSLKSFPYQVTEASAVSAADIWAIGNARTPKNGIWAGLEHWTGHAWQPVTLPHITVPSGDGLYALGVADIGPGNVWAEFGVGGSDPQTWTIKLAHLSHTGWSVATLPARYGVWGDIRLGQLIGSTPGGVWMGLVDKAATYVPGTGYPPVFVQPAGKSWRAVASPAPATAIAALAAVPGSPAAVAVGTLDPRSTGSQGIILGYGI